MSELDFDKVLYEFRGAYHEGHLKLQSNSLNFKNKKTNKNEQFQSNDIENLYWLKRSKGNCFKFNLKNGNTYEFDGFQESDYQKIDDYSKKYLKKPVEKTELSVKGWNWGKPIFKGDQMSFDLDNKTAFTIPLKNVSNTNVTKNEGILQFHQNEDASVSLMEIRFHIPNTTDTDVDAAQEFIDKVVSRADLQNFSDAEAICTLTELNCITPRGRYDVKFFNDFVDFHGKTFDYKIAYDHILRLFLLPHKDSRQMYFVMAMDPPMKQGNTRYPFLIVLFNIEESMKVDINVSEKTKEKFGDRLDKLDKVIEGPYHEVVSRICRTILDKRITVPGNFTTINGSKCYSCSYKANSGFLYPLERGFMFINKPPLHILFSDIGSVKFDRSAQATRSFDFELETKNGIKHTFSGIDKTEKERFQEFIKTKGINISKSDGSFTSKLDIDDDDEIDTYAERMKAAGREKTADDDDDDDDDDEEDEDFEGSSSSDDDIEYDSNASIDSASSGSDDSDGQKKEKKSKKKAGSPEKKKKKKSKSPEKASKSKSSSSKSASKPVEGAKQPKSAEFVEDSGSDSD